MPDRSDEYRKSALECLKLAGTVTDATIRESLLVMAQKWFDLANSGSPSHAAFDAAVRGLNEEQISPQPVRQRQQQIQPKDDEKKE